MFKIKSDLKVKVFNWFVDHPVDEKAKNKYLEVKLQFGLDRKQASAYWREFSALIEKASKTFGGYFAETKNTLNNKRPVEVLDVNTLPDAKSRGWAELSVRHHKFPSLTEQKEVIKKELFDYAQPVNISYPTRSEEDKILLELALFDVHFGKLAHREEVGEDYDLTIAVERYKTAVSTLVGRIDTTQISRILLPIGQDLINIDNLTNSTTSLTPQDTDSRFHKMVKTVKQVLIDTINSLALIAPVDVVVSVGNHDEQTSFMLGEILDAYYHNMPVVTIFNEATLRKYYQFGTTSIMFTHGNKEKFNELGMIFAAENPILWAATTQRYIQIGHFHHNKKATTLQTQEFQGFTVQVIPSLSGPDAWHTGKGYQSLKQAKAFLYSERDGLIGEFTHTVK